MTTDSISRHAPIGTIVVFLSAVFAMGSLDIDTVLPAFPHIVMEPVGHLAGMASSLIASMPMIVGTALAVPVGLAFDGSARPLVGAVLVFAAAGYAIVRRLSGQVPRPAA